MARQTSAGPRRLTVDPEAMRAGLRTLGYHDVYHMAAPMAENPRDAEMWVPAYRAKYQGQGKLYGREEFDKLLGHCMVGHSARGPSQCMKMRLTCRRPCPTCPASSESITSTMEGPGI